MSTLIAVVIRIVIGFSGQRLWLTALNIAGMPGALIGLQFRRDHEVGSVRGILGIAVAVLGQSYAYLAFVALVVSLTKYYIHQNGVSPVFVWPASFFACVFPIYLCAAAEKLDAILIALAIHATGAEA
jgi:hypothetical protein